MPLFQLPSDATIFPDPSFTEPNGLLAIGGDLSPERLISAYRQGIFPWYTEGEPLLWWSPSPRLVLFPQEFHLPKSLARTIRRSLFTVRADANFTAVINACATTRLQGGEQTWITAEMRQAYIHLFDQGFAHSVECYQDGKLVGGLYGICIDKVFFGESMFTVVSDASKVALAALITLANKKGINCIDCQMTTDHLIRFGAREIDREEFQQLLRNSIRQANPQKKWRLPYVVKEETT